MEEALLKVTRFNNSDVIATSGDTPSGDYCTVHTYHFIPESLNTGTKGDEWVGTVYATNNNGVWGKSSENVEYAHSAIPSTATSYEAWGYNGTNWEYCGKKSK